MKMKCWPYCMQLRNGTPNRKTLQGKNILSSSSKNDYLQQSNKYWVIRCQVMTLKLYKKKLNRMWWKMDFQANKMTMRG